MSRLAEIRSRSTWADILEGQPQHAMLAVLLTLGTLSLFEPSGPKLWGLSATGWASWSIGLALVHQVLVGFVFRLQLHRNTLSRIFGDLDMKIWAVMFLPLLAARPFTLLMTGLSDDVPIMADPLPLQIFGWALAIPAVWALYSTFVFFTIPRALGGDHFRDEIAELPLVNKGTFKYVSNSMYGVAFLGLWSIALITNSWNALAAALFQHAYIWVHMYCTEGPDMRWIYRDR